AEREARPRGPRRAPLALRPEGVLRRAARGRQPRAGEGGAQLRTPRVLAPAGEREGRPARRNGQGRTAAAGEGARVRRRQREPAAQAPRRQEARRRARRAPRRGGGESEG